MKSLRRMLGITETAPKASAEPLLDLQATLDARKRAQEALSAAKAAVQRVRAVIHAADIDEASADTARVAAAASTKAWAERGALPNEPSGDQALLTRATNSERKAAESRFKAEGAASGMRAIQDAEQAAQYAVDTAETIVQEQVVKMLVAQVENDLAIIEHARSSCAESHARVQGLAHVMNHGGWYGLPNSGGGTDLLRRLNELQPRTLSESELRERSQPWVAFAKRLAADPDATLKL